MHGNLRHLLYKITMISLAIRHRLLEGVLLRLAKLPDAGGIVLRGGMLLRHWFRPTPRPALDLDLVAHSPLALSDAKRFLPMFADIVADGVKFDVEGIAAHGIWLQSDHPGIARLLDEGNEQADTQDAHQN